MPTVILGAGLTGLAASHKTGGTIYEATNVPGGLCRSYHSGKYMFEQNAGHWMFGDGSAIDFIKKFAEFDEYEAISGVYFNHIFNYPIQTWIDSPSPICSWSLKGSLNERFGKELCKMFFFPFNNKYTAGIYDEILQDDPLKSPNPGQKTHCQTFIYPKLGMEYLINNLVKNIDIRYMKRAVEIDVDYKFVKFSDGTKVSYDRLISTIPLHALLKMCGQSNYGLVKTSTLVINIGAERGKNLPNNHWLYLPFGKSGIHRIQFYSNVSPIFAPEGKVSLCTEMAFHGVDGWEVETEDAKNAVLEELKSYGFIGMEEVTDCNWIDCAYTWLAPGHVREKGLSWLKDKGIDSIGRYGKWKFKGMAAGIEEGLCV